VDNNGTPKYYSSENGTPKDGGEPDSFSKTQGQNPESTAAFEGDFAKTEDFEKPITISRKSSDKILEEGILQYKKLNYYKALELLSRAIELNPSCCEAYYYRGKVKSDLGEYGKAISDLDEAIRLNPVYIPAYNNRGMLKANLGDYFGAQKDFGAANREKRIG